ncbi:MAG: hypothetical protein HYY26_03490 [Acidobacteria bacterium]|nr:hypothetical protein [Acidobacteriota bacterium]
MAAVARFEFLEALEEEWQPVGRVALAAWLVFYALFLLHALASRSGFLLVDSVNLVIHEAGHLLFSYLGQTMMLWGGTLFQLFVPLALGVHFTFRRHTAGAAFAAFFFFENFLNIATYMADARRQELPLVTIGDPELAGHDWFLIFSHLGVLPYDTKIAAVVRAAGWLGMLGTVAWLVWRGRLASEAYRS